MKRLRDTVDYLWPAPVAAILGELLLTIAVLGGIFLITQLHQPPSHQPAVRNMPYVRHVRLLPYVMLPSPSRVLPAPTVRSHG